MQTIILAAVALLLAAWTVANLATGRLAFPRWAKIAGWAGIICAVLGVACLIVENLARL